MNDNDLKIEDKLDIYDRFVLFCIYFIKGAHTTIILVFAPSSFILLKFWLGFSFSSSNTESKLTFLTLVFALIGFWVWFIRILNKYPKDSDEVLLIINRFF